MRQSAWLNTAPDPSQPNKSTNNKPKSSQDAKPMTRLQLLQARDQAPDMPPPGAAAHLVGYLYEIGPVSSGGMGAVVISWQELHAWQEATGVELASWEARGLKRLSQEYLSTSHEAQAHDCPAPYADQLSFYARAVISDKVSHIFGNRKTH